MRVCVRVCTNGGFVCMYVYGEEGLMEYGVLRYYNIPCLTLPRHEL